jgi:ammonia channel protein AmtB
MEWTTGVWFVFGYSLRVFGDAGGAIGDFDMALLHRVGLATPPPNPGMPLFRHVANQTMFASIVPALTAFASGACRHRRNAAAHRPDHLCANQSDRGEKRP